MFASSLEAEQAFYAAFEAGDLEAMMRVWAYSFDIVCVHPAGPRLEGVDAIRRSWRHILADPVLRSFDLRGRLVVGSDDIRIHTLEEHIGVPGSHLYAPPVLATNVYHRLDDGWRMILHHASMLPPPGAPPPVPNGRVH
ncbi:MAG: nuclear transport factor 2 family protein [Gammaproteobacteria bacterium]